MTAPAFVRTDYGWPFGFDLDRDGTPWYNAPIPSRLHRCTVWSAHHYPSVGSVVFCACGADRFEGHWFNRNTRRKKGTPS